MRLRLFGFFLVGINLINFCHGFLDGWWKSPTVKKNENVTGTLTSDPQELDVVRYHDFKVLYEFRGEVWRCISLKVKSTPKTITTLPPSFTLCPNNASSNFSIEHRYNTTSEGIVTLEVETDPSGVIDTEEAFVNLNVKIKAWIDTFGDVMGWVYTIAWDISFLPQIFHNWKRKSVIGLSFDFLTLNFIGFSCYFFFNMGLYWIPAIEDQYHDKYPTSFLHVRLNDVIFPLYAVLCTSVQILQCFIYERGNQRVSITCRIISGLLLLSAVIYAILVGAVDDVEWIDFLYWLSYIKLIISTIKYFPQLYQNYKLKSTEGWSIWNVILDFTGGSLSILQMFVLAYNYDDMHSVLTDPTKLGLGLLSIFFNIFFFMQHFWLYKNKLIEDNKSKEENTEKEKQVVTTVF